MCDSDRVAELLGRQPLNRGTVRHDVGGGPLMADVEGVAVDQGDVAALDICQPCHRLERLGHDIVELVASSDHETECNFRREIEQVRHACQDDTFDRR